MIRQHLRARLLAVFAVTVVLVSGMTGIVQAGTAHGGTAPVRVAGLVRGAGSSNPYAPSHGHPYRFGAVATRQAQAQMEAYRGQHPSKAAAAVPSDGLLHYGGGPVVSGPPRVYLVFWGPGWGVFRYDIHGDHTFSRDPFAGAPKLQELFKGLGTGGELWSGVMTQYCQGVATGATSCANTDSHVSYPAHGVLAGVLYDDIAAAPVNATADQVGDEAVRSAQIFGNTTAGANHDAQYVILSPTGYHPDGFGPASSWCAWHGWVNSSYGAVAFTNLPYVMDRGQACGMGLINGSSGALDGYTIDAGHEYAETLTDPLPTSGWDDPALGSEGENVDKCASLLTLGGNVTTTTGTFALPSTWSNDAHFCTMSHAVLPIRTAVPDVMGATLTRAGQALTAAGLIRGAVSTVVDCGNVGLVITQHPVAGTVVPVGATVTLTVGANPKPPLHCS